MKTETKYLLLIGLAISIVWFIYVERALLTVFLLSAGFAYILNPLVSFLAKRLKLPRGLSVTIVYFALISFFFWATVVVGTRLGREMEEFSSESKPLLQNIQMQTSNLPDWLQTIVDDSIVTLRNSIQLAPRRVLPYFPSALSRAINVFIFFFAGFYFLKDGHKFFESLKNMLPSRFRIEADILSGKINKILGDYLRGELLLVLIMSTLTYIGLLILGVRYALILAVFTGFAELLPFIGPTIATLIAVTVAYFDGVSSLGLPPIYEITVIAAMYFLLRQLEDLFVIPHVLGRMTKLHPLVVMFAVLAGGHLMGAVGFIIAVPLVASARVVIQYLMER